MKLNLRDAKSNALTRIEVVVIIGVLALLASLISGGLSAARKSAQRESCVDWLKNDGLAIRIWAGDHNDHRPQNLSITNGGAMELIADGNVAAYFQIMSNELATPIVLHCPDDEEHSAATNFSPPLKATDISYFVGLNPDNSSPQAIMFGDDNLELDGAPVKSGVINLWTNHSVLWNTKRHHLAGNVALFDGSVAQASNRGLTNLVAQTSAATNLIIIP